MTRHYVTTAAAAHLPQLRVLHASMRRHCAPFRLHVLAEGGDVIAWCRDQHDVSYDSVHELLWRHPGLAPSSLPGPQRTPSERAWCWRWWFAGDVLEDRGEPVTVLDTDLMFFSNPEPVFEEIGAAPAAFLPHAFPPASAGLPGANQESHGKWGVFNAGFSVWAARAPLARMAELCREWSWAKHRTWPDGSTTYGEQGNEERVQLEFPGVHVIQHVGAAPGPWNIHAATLEPPPRAGAAPLFGGREVVAFHFQSLRLGGQLADAPYAITERQVAILYAPYLAELERNRP